MNGLIGIHLAVCVCCFVFWRKSGNGPRPYRFVIVLFLPVAGVLFLIFTSLLEKVQPAFRTGTEPEAEPTGPLPAAGLLIKMDVEKEINIAPLEEVLILNRDSVKRRLLIDMLKRAGEPDIPLLREALGNEDSETSHYAAAAMVDIKSKLMEGLRELPDENRFAEMDAAQLKACAEPVERYLNSGFADETGSSRWKEQYRAMLDRILIQEGQEEKYYVDRINCALDNKDFDSAAVYCKRYLKDYATSAGPYEMNLKLQYASRDRKGFFAALERLEYSKVRLPESMSNTVKFWTEGGA